MTRIEIAALLIAPLHEKYGRVTDEQIRATLRTADRLLELAEEELPALAVAVETPHMQGAGRWPGMPPRVVAAPPALPTTQLPPNPNAPTVPGTPPASRAPKTVGG